MDVTGMEVKKRKLEENGIGTTAGLAMTGGQGDVTSSADGNVVPSYLTRDDVSVMVDLLSQEELHSIVMDSTLRHRDVLDEVRKLTSRDPSQRKIFVRGLGWDTTTVSLRNTFSEFGELEEAIAIMDKNTGKSRGYGFVTYKYIDGARNALKEPSKRIDGRISVCQLASTGPGSNQPPQDLAMRKIYVGNVPMDWPVDRMLSIFSEYGEIEEGPLGLDKQVGKARGYALFIYKSADSAKRVLEEPVKHIDGHQLFCKLALEGVKQRASIPGQSDMAELGIGQPGSAGLPSVNVPYGGSQFGGAPQMISQGLPYGQSTNPVLNTGLNTSLNLGMNSSMLPSVGGAIQNQPVANAPSIVSSLNPPLGQSLNLGVNPVGTQTGLPSYGSHSVMDSYGLQTSSYSGQHGGGGYSGVAVTASSMYSTTPGSMTTQNPLQSQYGLQSYQGQQQLHSSYQGQQQQVPLSYQSQPSAMSSAPRMQQTGGPPSIPYYGI